MNLTPKEIVSKLDKHIVGQNRAKRAVAIALRNRYRRSQLSEDLKEEVVPKNILMIGPTGVGKTEIARRLAKLVKAPFIKIEATKFTEVGYVGRDVESMIRDLVDVSVRMVKSEKLESVKEKAKILVDERILDILLPSKKSGAKFKNPFEMFMGSDNDTTEDPEEKVTQASRKKEYRQKLENGELEEKVIEIEVEENVSSAIDMFMGSGNDQMGMNMQEMINQFIPKKTKKRRLPIAEAREILLQQEGQKLIDMDQVASEAIRLVEENGIVFLDEIDKVSAKGSHGPDVSREGVQRDILPIVEGSTVVSKHGSIKTDHILFIAAGAFHIAKPSDLIPELQGRFPIRVELSDLNAEEFTRILTEPKNALIKQYIALLETEGIKIKFTDEAVEHIAKLAAQVNQSTENIGARRLHTILEKLLEDLSFEAPDLKMDEISITPSYVEEKLNDIATNKDLSQYIL